MIQNINDKTIILFLETQELIIVVIKDSFLLDFEEYTESSSLPYYSVAKEQLDTNWGYYVDHGHGSTLDADIRVELNKAGVLSSEYSYNMMNKSEFKTKASMDAHILFMFNMVNSFVATINTLRYPENNLNNDTVVRVYQ